MKTKFVSKPANLGTIDEKEPNFRFKCTNLKKQYHFNKVIEKTKAAKEEGDEELRNNLLEEGEHLLIECNKHNCITEKYSWYILECCTIDPIRSD